MNNKPSSESSSSSSSSLSMEELLRQFRPTEGSSVSAVRMPDVGLSYWAMFNGVQDRKQQLVETWAELVAMPMVLEVPAEVPEEHRVALQETCTQVAAMHVMLQASVVNEGVLLDGMSKVILQLLQQGDSTNPDLQYFEQFMEVNVDQAQAGGAAAAQTVIRLMTLLLLFFLASSAVYEGPDKSGRPATLLDLLLTPSMVQNAYSLSVDAAERELQQLTTVSEETPIAGLNLPLQPAVNPTAVGTANVSALRTSYNAEFNAKTFMGFLYPFLGISQFDVSAKEFETQFNRNVTTAYQDMLLECNKVLNQEAAFTRTDVSESIVPYLKGAAKVLVCKRIPLVEVQLLENGNFRYTKQNPDVTQALLVLDNLMSNVERKKSYVQNDKQLTLSYENLLQKLQRIRELFKVLSDRGTELTTNILDLSKKPVGSAGRIWSSFTELAKQGTLDIDESVKSLMKFLPMYHLSEAERQQQATELQELERKSAAATKAETEVESLKAQQDSMINASETEKFAAPFFGMMAGVFNAAGSGMLRNLHLYGTMAFLMGAFVAFHVVKGGLVAYLSPRQQPGQGMWLTVITLLGNAVNVAIVNTKGFLNKVLDKGIAVLGSMKTGDASDETFQKNNQPEPEITYEITGFSGGKRQKSQGSRRRRRERQNQKPSRRQGGRQRRKVVFSLL